MGNKHRGQITAPFNGGTINLMLSTNAICELEDLDGRPITEIIEDISDPAALRMVTMRKVFWAMMLDEKPDATLADAGAMIDGLRGKSNEILASAVAAAFPDPEGGDVGKTNAAANGIG